MSNVLGSVVATIDSRGGVLGFSINGYPYTIGMVKTKDFSYSIDLRSNLALLHKGQELTKLKFKGNKEIENSKIEFTKDGVFVFSIQGVVFKQSISLKEMTQFLSTVLEL